MNIKTFVNDLQHIRLHDSEVNEFINQSNITVIKLEHMLVQPARAISMGSSATYNPDLVTIITYENKELK